MAWNRPANVEAASSPLQGKGRVSAMKRRGRSFPIVVSVAVVVVGAAAGWFILSQSNRWSETSSRTPAKRIKEVRPTVPIAVKPVEKDYTKLTNAEIRKLPESETNHLSRAMLGYWKMYHPWPPPSKDQPRANRGRYAIFESRVDNEIAMVLSTEPGTVVFGNRRISDDFGVRFQESLKSPIIVKSDDSEYAKELKRSVIEAKADLKAALDRGEDIGEMMNQSLDELRRLGRYRAQLEKDAYQVLLKDDVTADDVVATVSAVNKMLEEKGIGPIDLNSMSKIACKYQLLRLKEQKQ